MYKHRQTQAFSFMCVWQLCKGCTIKEVSWRACVCVCLSVRTFGKLLYTVDLVLPTFYRWLNGALSSVYQRKSHLLLREKSNPGSLILLLQTETERERYEWQQRREEVTTLNKRYLQDIKRGNQKQMTQKNTTETKKCTCQNSNFVIQYSIYLST